jgi:endonuclease/exonuclease/phosphatase family metal-dependent hydrolase
MPYYQYIKTTTADGKRTIDRLLKLRTKLALEIPEKHLESNLIIASWNIREFDSPAYGDRVDEAFYYIAEIVSKFDIIAIQEVRQDLKALKKLVRILGDNWEYLVTDVTEGSQGNKERLAFLFDTRKVKFGGLAGQVVLPPFETKDPQTGQTIYQPAKQLARTPYMCGFKAGWTNFALSTVHILYGADAANNPDRIKEIDSIAQALARKAADQYEWSHNLILLGDFNIYSPADETYSSILKAGFQIPPQLQNLPSNALQNKFYDQIAFNVKPNEFETTGKAGVFNYYDVVFTDADESAYISLMGDAYNKTEKGTDRKDKSVYYKTYWRTFQMSDHLPMWVEIKIDHTDDYLKNKLVPPQVANDATTPSN